MTHQMLFLLFLVSWCAFTSATSIEDIDSNLFSRILDELPHDDPAHFSLRLASKHMKNLTDETNFQYKVSGSSERPINQEDCEFLQLPFNAMQVRELHIMHEALPACNITSQSLVNLKKLFIYYDEPVFTVIDPLINALGIPQQFFIVNEEVLNAEQLEIYSAVRARVVQNMRYFCTKIVDRYNTWKHFNSSFPELTNLDVFSGPDNQSLLFTFLFVLDEVDMRKTPWMRQIYIHIIQKIHKLLWSNKFDVNYPVPHYGSLLHLAVKALRHQQPIIIGLLIASGANVNSRNADGLTPIQIAWSQCDRHTTKLLLLNRAHANFDIIRLCPRDTDAVFLIEIMNISSTLNKHDLMEEVIRFIPYPRRTISLLANSGLDLNYVDAAGYSYLEHAIFYSPTTIATLSELLSNGANINMRVGSKSALTTAIKHSSRMEYFDYEVIQYLLENGGDTNNFMPEEEFPLLLAVEKNEIHFFDLVLSHTEYDPHKWMAVYNKIIAQYGISSFSFQGMFISLVNTGLGVNLTVPTGETLLSESLLLSQLDLAEYLIERGCNKNPIEANGNSLLNQWVYESMLALNILPQMELLLEHGANTSVISENGTALHLIVDLFNADEAVHFEILKMVLKAPTTDIAVKNKEEKSALSIAVSRRIPKLVHLLCQTHFDHNLWKEAFDELSIKSEKFTQESYDILEILLGTGLDPYVPVEGDVTLVDYISERAHNYHREIADYSEQEQAFYIQRVEGLLSYYRVIHVYQQRFQEEGREFKRQRIE